MFCDLVGSTALSSRLDPEDLREVIAAYHRAVTEIVAGFEGFVSRYMGDGVLVYFGYPQAHEDDAERAVRAGLGAIDAVGRLDDRQPGAHRPLGIVLMRLRIAEIDQHSIAHVLGDKAVEAADRIGDCAVVFPDQPAQILGVIPRRERGRADEIAEHHRQLPALRIDWRT